MFPALSQQSKKQILTQENPTKAWVTHVIFKPWKIVYIQMIPSLQGSLTCMNTRVMHTSMCTYTYMFTCCREKSHTWPLEHLLSTLISFENSKEPPAALSVRLNTRRKEHALSREHTILLRVHLPGSSASHRAAHTSWYTELQKYF